MSEGRVLTDLEWMGLRVEECGSQLGGISGV